MRAPNIDRRQRALVGRAPGPPSRRARVPRLHAPLAPPHAGVPLLRCRVAERPVGIRRTGVVYSFVARASSHERSDGRRGAVHHRHGRSRRRRPRLRPRRGRLRRSGSEWRPEFVDHDAWTELRLPREPDEHVQAAIAGVGYTEFSRDSGRSVLSLATEACRNALDDAGLAAAEVDGVASFMVMHDSVPLPGRRDVARRARSCATCSTPTSAARRRATSPAWRRWRSPPGRPATCSVFRAAERPQRSTRRRHGVRRPRRPVPLPDRLRRTTSCTSACGRSASCTRPARASRPRRRRDRAARVRGAQRARAIAGAARPRDATSRRRTSSSRSAPTTARSRSTARARSS